LGYTVLDTLEYTQISNILLCFSHSGFTKQQVQYAVKERNQLHLQPRYKEDLENLIIFSTSENYQKLFINNIITNEYITIYKNDNNEKLIMGIYLYISQGSCVFPIYNFKLKFISHGNNRIVKSDKEDKNITNHLYHNKVYDNKTKNEILKLREKMKEVYYSYEKIKRSNIVW